MSLRDTTTYDDPTMAEFMALTNAIGLTLTEHDETTDEARRAELMRRVAKLEARQAQITESL